MINEKYSKLINEAIEARKKSYSPYSHFAVGASLLCADGTVFTGANIENSSYTPTVCAERVAFFEAINKGHRDFLAIAIVGGKDSEKISDFCPPCGVCRQVMSEFCNGNFEIILSNGTDTNVFTLDEIMPCRFDLLK